MGKKKQQEVLLVNPEDTKVEASQQKKPAKRKKPVEVVEAKPDAQMDYKEGVRMLRSRLRGFTVDNFEAFVVCWQNIKDPQKKAQMYLDAMKILMPAQSVIDIDIGTKEEDSFAMKLLILRDRAEQERGGQS